MRYAPLSEPGRRKGPGLPARRMRWHSTLAVCAVAGLAATGLMTTAGTAVATAGPPNRFTATPLIANDPSAGASLTDPQLTNAWGLAAAPTGPIWVSDNQSGLATVYTGGVSGSPVNLALTVQVPGGNPTGQVFNGDTSAFPVGGVAGTHSVFIIDSDQNGDDPSGMIGAWAGGAAFTVEDSSTGGAGGTVAKGAIFKGLAIADNTANGPELFAADVHNARVEVFDSNFHPLNTPGEFRDPFVPRGWAPFGIQNLNGMIYVSYGKQNADKSDVTPGHGLGMVAVFTVDGKLVHHLVRGGCFSPLNEPWGLAIAPAGFGPFAGDLLVGNLGDGRINAFDPTTGRFLGPLRTANGHPFQVDGLWGLQVGNTAFGGPSSVIYSAGPGQYQSGVVGILNPAS
jgi:uncharacterized protein (TIGR03118 family)